MKRLSAQLAIAPLLLLGISVSAQAQTLPLVTERVGEDVSFWWERPDSALVNQLESDLITRGGTGWLDPRRVTAPSVSRSYRVADLSDINARNMGSLFGASMVLTGELRVDTLTSIADGLFWTATVSVDVQLLDVREGDQVLAIARESFGEGRTSEDAMTAAVSSVAESIIWRVDQRNVDSELTVPDNGLPTLMVRGMDNAFLLITFKGDLRRHDTIVADVREAWATEGVVGLEVRLQEGAQLEQLVTILYDLELNRDAPYELIVHAWEGLSTYVDLTSPVTEALDSDVSGAVE